MDFVLLDQSSGEQFKDALSKEALARLDEAAVLSIGAVDNGEIAGAAAFGIRRGVMELLSVSGRAEQLLLEELLSLADGYDAVQSVCADFPADSLFDDYAELLAGAGFRQTGQYTLYQLPMEALKSTPLALGNADSRIVPLADVPAVRLRALEREAGQKGSLPPVIVKRDYLPHGSTALLSPNGIDALVLLAPRRAGGCRLCGMWGRQPQQLSAALSAALTTAVRHAPKSAVFEFAAASPAEQQLAQRLFPAAEAYPYRVFTLGRA